MKAHGKTIENVLHNRKNIYRALKLTCHAFPKGTRTLKQMVGEKLTNKMMNEATKWDNELTSYSKKLMKQVKYHLDNEESLNR